MATNFNMALGFYSLFLHDFAGKGEYNVLRGVSKSDICCFRGVILIPYNCKLPWKFLILINVNKLWFIHELTANDTSKTAKNYQNYPQAHRLSVNVLLSNVTFL